MGKSFKTALLAGAGLALSLNLLGQSVGPAAADSCWNHNGSLMRLVAQGNQRWFYYEVPRPAIRAQGVAPGTLLFNGWKDGDTYAGTARVFSKYCPAAPLEYQVRGPVAPNQLKVTLYGTRPAAQRCQPTGGMIDDTLVFTYGHQC